MRMHDCTHSLSTTHARARIFALTFKTQRMCLPLSRLCVLRWADRPDDRIGTPPAAEAHLKHNIFNRGTAALPLFTLMRKGLPPFK